MSTFKSIGLKSVAILLLSCATIAHAVPIDAEIPLVYAGEPGFDTVAFAIRLTNSALKWDDPAIYDQDAVCSFCDGLLFADHGWSLRETIDPLVAGVGGPAIVNGQSWGFFAVSFFADPTLYPIVELEAIAFDTDLDPMNPQLVTLTYDIASEQYLFTDVVSSEWSPTYNSVFAMPEAGSLALLGIGIVGFGMARWRRQTALMRIDSMLSRDSLVRTLGQNRTLS